MRRAEIASLGPRIGTPKGGNVIGVLLAGALLTAGLTRCNVDADMFDLWLKQGLFPKRPPTSMIVMDNATFHKQCVLFR